MAVTVWKSAAVYWLRYLLGNPKRLAAPLTMVTTLLIIIVGQLIVTLARTPSMVVLPEFSQRSAVTVVTTPTVSPITDCPRYTTEDEKAYLDLLSTFKNE
jgi:hypothetical protein